MKCFSFLLFGLLLALRSFAISPITGVTHLCVAGTTALAVATTGGIWVSSNTAVATVGTSGVVHGVVPGTSTITYFTSAGLATAMVTVNPLPVVFAVTGGGSYCADDSGVHIGLAGSQPGVNYLLFNGSSSSGPFAGTGLASDFGWQTAAGIYTVTGTIAATGCTVAMAGSTTVIINPMIMDSVSITNGVGDTICAGVVTTFAAVPVAGGSAPGFRWMVNGVNVGTDSINYTYAPVNGDIIQVTMTSNVACASADSVTGADTMTVFPNAFPVVAIVATPSLEVCKGFPAVLTVAPLYGGPSPTYTWNKDGVNVASGSSYTFVPVLGDTVYCTMMSDYRCRLADSAVSTTVSMIVDSPVTPYIAIIPSPGYVIAPGESDTLRAVVTNGGSHLTFEWVVNGTVVADDTSDTYISNTFAAPYPDSITCTVTGGGACRVSSYTWVYIVVSINALGTPAYSLSGDVLNVFPNPSNGMFSVKGSFGNGNSSEVQLEVSDMLGRIIYSNNAPVNAGQLNTGITLNNGEANPGLYILTVRSGTQSQVFHILVQ